jgi:hypothetical protein
MMNLKQVGLVCAVAVAASQAVSAQATLEIALKQGSAAEPRTRDQLRRLVTTYDLSPWFYTKSIVIDERAIPLATL